MFICFRMSCTRTCRYDLLQDRDMTHFTDLPESCFILFLRECLELDEIFIDAKLNRPNNAKPYFYLSLLEKWKMKCNGTVGQLQTILEEAVKKNALMNISGIDYLKTLNQRSTYYILYITFV